MSNKYEKSENVRELTHGFGDTEQKSNERLTFGVEGLYIWAEILDTAHKVA